MAMAALGRAGHAACARDRARGGGDARARARGRIYRARAIAREAENVDAAADLAAASIARAGEDVASRLKALMVLGRTRRASGEGVLPQERRNAMTRVMGCASASWIYVELDERGRTRASCASESDATAGYGALLCDVITGRAPGDVLGLDDSFVDAMQIGIGSKMEKSRANGFKNMLETAKKQLRALEAGASANSDPFPSLIVRADEVRARGSFAASQASYLEPDEGKVRALVDVLQAKKIGIVAHFYMDPEVQGVLMAAKASYPHIAISDSLVMAD